MGRVRQRRVGGEKAEEPTLGRATRSAPQVEHSSRLHKEASTVIDRVGVAQPVERQEYVSNVNQYLLAFLERGSNLLGRERCDTPSKQL